MNRGTKINAIEDLVNYAKDTENEYVFFVPTVKDFSEQEIMDHEFDLLGYYVTKHPLDACPTIIKDYSQVQDLPQHTEGSTVTIGGLIVEAKEILTKKGQQMAFLQLEDLTGRIEVVVFSNTYKKYKHILYNGNIVALSGKLEFANDDDDDNESLAIPKILLYKVKPLEMRRNIAEYVITINKNDDLRIIEKIVKENPGKVPLNFDFYNFKVITNSFINDSVDVLSRLEEECLIKGITDEN